MVILKKLKYNEEISIWKNDAFCFDNLSFDVTEDEFLDSQKDCILVDVVQGIDGEEHIYSRKFLSETFRREVKVYYYFKNNIFQKGVYEMSYNKEEVSGLCDEIIVFMQAENEEFVTHTWKSYLNEDNELYLSDHQNNVCFLYLYNEMNEGRKDYIFAIEIYRGTDYGYWPEDIEECWNVEKDGNSNESEKLCYLENKLDLVSFSADSLSVVDIESREKLTFSLSDDLSIWAQLNPAAYGVVSYELLVKVEKDAKRRIWRLGLNRQGEVEHLIECMLP